ncbi:transposase, partial [Streptomyces sp. NPDC004533]|uniref:transposase n=1 Tax=Streptomyces sp. NPDC004533 TaxID=3154278 RepID=UPI0033A53E6B
LTLAALAHNLTRALGTLASAFHAKARTGTIRRQLLAIPARLAAGARTLTFHLPERWPWEAEFTTLWTAIGCRLRT